MKRFDVGSKVTLKSGEKEGYYSSYGMNPRIVFREGMVGIIATNDTPVVRGTEGAWFYCVDFDCEATGRKERVALYHHEIREI